MVFGRNDGVVEMRRSNDLAVISSFNVYGPMTTEKRQRWGLPFHFRPAYSHHSTNRICELVDGSFVSLSMDRINLMKRWDENGSVLQTFYGEHSRNAIKVIELKSDTIVTLTMSEPSQNTVAIWKLSTGQLLHTLTSHRLVSHLMKLSEDKLLTFSQSCFCVWNMVNGECVETVATEFSTRVHVVMTRVGDAIVTVDHQANMQVRKLKYEFFIHPFLLLFLPKVKKNQAD